MTMDWWTERVGERARERATCNQSITSQARSFLHGQVEEVGAERYLFLSSQKAPAAAPQTHASAVILARVGRASRFIRRSSKFLAIARKPKNGKPTAASMASPCRCAAATQVNGTTNPLKRTSEQNQAHRDRWRPSSRYCGGRLRANPSPARLPRAAEGPVARAIYPLSS